MTFYVKKNILFLRLCHDQRVINFFICVVVVIIMHINQRNIETINEFGKTINEDVIHDIS